MHPLRQFSFRLVERLWSPDVLTACPGAPGGPLRGIPDLTYSMRTSQHGRLLLLMALAVQGNRSSGGWNRWGLTTAVEVTADELRTITLFHSPEREGSLRTLGQNMLVKNSCRDSNKLSNSPLLATPLSIAPIRASKLLMLLLEISTRVRSNLLDHASAVMTLDRYGHLLSDDLTKVATALDRAARKAAA